MRIILLGTRGVPAQYGGFETAVEEIGSRLACRHHDVTVYCRNRGQAIKRYKGMRLVNLPALRRRSLETLSHTLLSSVHAIATQGKPDVILLFNSANIVAMPLLRLCRAPIIVHLDGLESRRDKWGRLGKRYYAWSERTAARCANAVIADSQALAQIYRSTYGIEPAFIAYGAPVRERGYMSERLTELGLGAGNFHLIVARFEPENRVREAVSAYVAADATMPLVVVGGAPYADAYVASIKEVAAGANVHMLGPVYDQELLDALYANCSSYVHGHTVGGTNPSLLRAMGAGAVCLASSVVFNREVLNGGGMYWRDAEELAGHYEWVERHPEAWSVFQQQNQTRVASTYSWDSMTDQVEDLFEAVQALAGLKTSRR